MVRLERGPQSVELDLSLGTIRRLTLVHEGRRLDPLHRAPWLDDPEVAEAPDLLPVERALSGDFFCAPFGSDGRADVPAHGWTANSEWVPDGDGTFRLVRDVFGAAVRKTVRLIDGAPMLVQHHEIRGGTGPLTVAHHPMLRVSGAGRLSWSAKRRLLTPTEPLEPHHVLAYPAEAEGAAMPGVDGPVDLSRVPIGTRHEDFVSMVEADGSRLGWTAVVRETEDDVVFFLKDPSTLPVTMLWFSNGGRDYPPWNGCHVGVIGVEDGCVGGAKGLAEAAGPNAIRALGVPTALELAPGRVHRVGHVTGAIARPEGWTRVAHIDVAGEVLTVTGDTGTSVTLPFDQDWITPS